MINNEKAAALMQKEKYDFCDLVLIMELLRGEGGCPWDAEQTHESIRKNFIEETYEVVEAIDAKDTKLLREELGDVMLQVVFHAQIEKEAGSFDINDVANDICAKLIHRHPHVFGESQADTSEKVLKAWETIKNEEKSRVTLYEKLKSIPPMTPALMRAQKVSEKSGKYKEISSEALVEQIAKEAQELSCQKTEDLSNKIGNLLFLISALSSKQEIDAEKSLFDKTNNFIEDFNI